MLIQVTGKIQFLAVVGQRRPRPCWLSAEGSSQLLDVLAFLAQGSFPSSSKPTNCISLLLLSSPSSHLSDPSEWEKFSASKRDVMIRSDPLMIYRIISAQDP